MEKDILSKLLESVFFEAVDGYETSKAEMNQYEEKYAMSSFDFYTKFMNKHDLANISKADQNEWYFLCTTFISCDGDLKKLAQERKRQQKDQVLDQVLAEILDYITTKPSEEENKFRERVDVTFSRFLLQRFA